MLSWPFDEPKSHGAYCCERLSNIFGHFGDANRRPVSPQSNWLSTVPPPPPQGHTHRQRVSNALYHALQHFKGARSNRADSKRRRVQSAHMEASSSGLNPSREVTPSTLPRAYLWPPPGQPLPSSRQHRPPVL